MVKNWSIALGLGLIILGIAGITSPFTTQSVAWLNLIVGIAALIFAGSVNRAAPKVRRAGGPIVFAIILFSLWAIELAAMPTATWQAWWNFIFAAAFLIVSIVAWNQKEPVVRQAGQDVSGRPRRSA